MSDELIEAMARIIDPSSWRVMDGYLAQMLRKYKGEHAGYDPDAFKHKESMAIARSLLPVIRAHLEPTSEMVEAAMDCGPIGCCNISSTEARDIILSALKALRDVGVAWDSAPTVAGLLDGRAAKWFFDTLAPAMIAARKALNEQAARAALGER